MGYLHGEEEKRARGFIDLASRVAVQSTCLRRKCGSVLVQYEEIIGAGFNSPPGELESQRRCNLQTSRKDYDEKVTDKTCCVHAEQRAILRALINNPDKIFGSTLYFSSVNENGIRIPSGEPYCTICSKLALEVGISKFVLEHKEGIRAYDIEEYNDISYKYGKNIGCIKP